MLKLFKSPDGEGSGGSTTPPAGNDSNDMGNDSNDNDSARIADYESQLARYKGDLTRMAEKMHEKNYNLRQRAQAAESRIPAEGSVVITATDAKSFKDYQVLGSVSELTDRQARLGQLEQFQMVSNAAGVVGMNPNVLAKLLAPGTKLEVGEATDSDGQAKRVVYIHTGSEGQKANLEQYAKENWSDFMPALKAEGEQNGRTWIQQQGSAAQSSDANSGVNPILTAKIEQAKKRAEPI